MRFFRLLPAAVLPLLLAPAQADARDLKLEEFFKGRTYAYGWFGAINGTTRRFKVVLDGRWNGQVLTLREAFEYEDGEKDVKTWRFRKTSPTTYLGTREDVIGETLVTLDGPRATFAYDVNLTPKAEPTIVRFFGYPAAGGRWHPAEYRMGEPLASARGAGECEFRAHGSRGARHSPVNGAGFLAFSVPSL